MEELGVVVVGIGIAGKVRCRDIGKSAEYVCAFPELEGVQLKGYCSRRDCEVEGVAKLSVEDALTRSDVQCVAICTENDNHVEMVRKALEAKKHVLVEFPLALNFPDAQELFQLAHSKGVKLHEENILLLADHMKNVLAKAKEQSVKKAKLTLSSKVSRLTERAFEGGPVFSHQIHLFHCLLLICGPLQPHSASVTFKEGIEGQRDLEVKAKLHTKENAEVEMELNFKSDPSTTRSSSYEYEFMDGTVLTNPPSVRPTPPTPPVPADRPSFLLSSAISRPGCVNMSLSDFELWPKGRLKPFLKARGLPVTANVQELRALAYASVVMEVPLVPSAEELDRQRAQDYKSLLAVQGKALPDPLSDLTSGWLSEDKARELWPPTMYSDMQEYLIDRNERSLQRRLMGDYKDGKAFSYFASGFIGEIWYHPISENSPTCFLRSTSARSQRRNDEDHKLWIAIEKKSGCIASAYCSCFAGYNTDG